MEQPKTLIIMRHAHAEALTEQLDDEQRKLTSAGIKQVKKVMNYLADLDLTPQHIVCSPYVRAHETAELISKFAQKTSKQTISVEIDSALALAAPVKQFTELLTNKVQDWPEVTILVSHEPNISRYFGALLGSKTSVFNVKKAAIGVFTLYSPTQAKLNAFIAPKFM